MATQAMMMFSLGEDISKILWMIDSLDLRSHERKLIVDTALDYLGVNNEARGDVVEEDKTGVGGQVQLRNTDPTDGTVIERSLEPLSGVGVETVLGEVLQVTTQRAETLRAHRVTLVSLSIISRRI